jgi:hypothetical protein
MGNPYVEAPKCSLELSCQQKSGNTCNYTESLAYILPAKRRENASQNLGRLSPARMRNTERVIIPFISEKMSERINKGHMIQLHGNVPCHEHTRFHNSY